MRVLGFETPSATSHECRPLWGCCGVLGKAASKTIQLRPFLKRVGSGGLSATSTTGDWGDLSFSPEERSGWHITASTPVYKGLAAGRSMGLSSM